MKSHLKNTVTLLYHFSLLLACFMLIRIAFYCYNFSFFGKLNFPEIVKTIYCGTRMDISALIYFNIVFILLFSVPVPIRYNTWYRIVLFVIFLVVNIVTTGINAGDVFYYPFNSKRLTADSLPLLREFFRLIPRFMLYYWYGFILFFGLLFLLGFLYLKIDRKNTPPGKFNYLSQSLLFLLICGLAFLGARGSVGRKPLMPIKASSYIGFQKAPVATNSVFTLIFSWNQKTLDELHYFNDDTLRKIYPLTKKYNRTPNRMNVVVIVLESFSAEFIGSLNQGRGYTPFLDSLAKNSLSCVNAFAVAERSMKGISAIIAGMPNLMEEDVQSSPYQTNCITGLGYFLKKMGYHTSFFHGGKNGAMSFDVYSKTVGFDHYFGRNEFNNDAFFDQYWGITDEEFFSFFADNIATFPEPFCSVLFSVSSHHPYFIPEKHKNRFPKGEEGIFESVGYTDYSLRQLFKKVSGQKWFANTLFVITADHSFPTRHPADSFYSGIAGRYRIPLFFHSGSQFSGTDSNIVQQYDILPSILDYAGFTEESIFFGSSIFSDTAKRYACFFQSGTYFVFDKQYLLLFTYSGPAGLFDYRRDFSLTNDLSLILPAKKEELETRIKAMLQAHNDVIIHNRLCPESSK